LREAARLFVEDRAKSGRDALVQVLSNDPRSLESLYKTYREREASLLRQAARVMEIEGDCGQTAIKSFDRRVHQDATPGTFALINANSTDWDAASRAGWHLAEDFGNGEALIRRDLWRVMSLGEFELTEPIQRWSREINALFGENQ